MKPLSIIRGKAIPFKLDNVDTDTIISAEWLKTVTREGVAEGAFEAIRAQPGNVFDRPENRGAPILLTGKNFGCGSSREHAIWALLGMGIRVVLAESFSDIFAGNAFKNGLLTIALPGYALALLELSADTESIVVDLENQCVSAAGRKYQFEFDRFRKYCLVNGYDEIDLTLQQQEKISSFEKISKRAWAVQPGHLTN